ncbi:MAG: ATP-binding cassette domain-containing protein, partial [Anaerolineae bacterium]|nr:ATP-binding cassette domain-containing protein [Anaerolineae bacterium]
LEGEEVRFRTPLDAQRAGVAIVYQELSVFPNLSVAENIFANRQPTGKIGFVDRGRMREETGRLLQIFALEFEPDVLVRDLDMGDRQMVEILRAVSVNPKLLILDEPTSSLTLAEAEHLFQLVERLREQGIAVLYVSHQLQEVLRLADRITVLRDGTYVGTVERAEAGEARLVRMMVGRAVDLYKDYGLHEARAEVALKVEGLTRPGVLEDISFELRRGEILGFAGLVGSGRTDLAQAIFGMHPISAGHMELLGKPFAPREPRGAVKRGLAYMPEDRKRVGLFLAMTLSDNIVAPQLYRFSRMGLLDDRGARQLTERYIDSMNIVARSLRQKAVTLSGGNQQKLLLSMWLALEPQVLIVDEPTRGIDVGAKVEIHDTLRRLADEGMSIMLISSELPEVLTMSDRVAVMREGRLGAVLPREDASEERIMAVASGVAEGGI